MRPRGEQPMARRARAGEFTREDILPEGDPLVGRMPEVVFQYLRDHQPEVFSDAEIFVKVLPHELVSGQKFDSHEAVHSIDTTIIDLERQRVPNLVQYLDRLLGLSVFSDGDLSVEQKSRIWDTVYPKYEEALESRDMRLSPQYFMAAPRVGLRLQMLVPERAVPAMSDDDYTKLVGVYGRRAEKFGIHDEYDAIVGMALLNPQKPLRADIEAAGFSVETLESALDGALQEFHSQAEGVVKTGVGGLVQIASMLRVLAADRIEVGADGMLQCVFPGQAEGTRSLPDREVV